MRTANKHARRQFIKNHMDFRVEVPEGAHGAYEIRRQTISQSTADFLNYKAMWDDDENDYEHFPGTYTQLIRMNPEYQDVVVMSDYHSEVADHEALVAYARKHKSLNHVLINGLGIGVLIELLMPYVKQITNVEISKSVIHLTAPYYQQKFGSKLNVVHCDAFKYQPPNGAHYDMVFHDIWDYITSTNLPEMDRLEQKYARLCDWQTSWAREGCEMLRLEYELESRKKTEMMSADASIMSVEFADSKPSIKFSFDEQAQP